MLYQDFTLIPTIRVAKPETAELNRLWTFLVNPRVMILKARPQAVCHCILDCTH